MIKSFCIYEGTLYWSEGYLETLLDYLSNKEGKRIDLLCDQGRIEEKYECFVIYVAPFFRKDIESLFNLNKKVIFRGSQKERNKSIINIEAVTIMEEYTAKDYKYLVKEIKINE